MKKKMLLGVFAVIVAALVGISVHAQPASSRPTYGKESTTVRVASVAGGCAVTEAPSPLGTKWGSTVTVVILGECGGPDKTIGKFRLISPMSAATPETPVSGDLIVRRLAPDVVVIEAHIIPAPARGADRVTYGYDVLAGGTPLQFRAPAPGRGAADPPTSPFLLSVCPMWPCE